MARILVADENEKMLESMLQILGDAGHTVVAAPEAESAFHFAQHFRPDLIIADIWMPRVTGFELLHKLRDADVGFKVIIVTDRSSVANIDIVTVANLLDASATLYKPFEPKELLELVDQVLVVDVALS